MARYRTRVQPRPPAASDIHLVQQTPGATRGSIRRPDHTWRTEVRPWELTPAFIAPVLPGDTMKSAAIQARMVMSSGSVIANRVTGWWHELYVFYVPLGTLDVAEVMRTAIIDPAANMSAIAAPADTKYMHQIPTNPNWLKECMKPIVRAYFRDEGEAWDSNLLNGYPVCQVSGSNWSDSALAASVLPAETGADDWAKSWSVFQGMRSSKLTAATWEEYLAMSGVTAPPLMRETTQDFRIPELLRFVRDFAYPQSTVDPVTGLVVGTIQWSLAERIDKARFFAEPGFIVGIQTVRPKVYHRRQRTVASNALLNTALGWLPPQFDQEPHTSIVKFLGSSGLSPIYAASVDHWLDRRDLFLRGDNFMNVDLATVAAASYNLVDLPAADLSNRRYPVAADQTAVIGSGVIQVDGIIRLNIASRIARDLTGSGAG